MWTRVLIAILVILIILAYVYHYNSYKQDYNISQTYLDTIDLSIVYEKYPVLIYDKVCEPKRLLTTLFAYTYIFSVENSVSPDVLVYNKSKHIILWSNQSDAIINIINPKYNNIIKWRKNEKTYLKDQDNNIQYVTVKLKENQVLILPTFWIFDSNVRLKCIALDDILSYANKLVLF